ncbi:MAG: hypothetical protein LUF26_07765 [Firmicutes bacterium]|nr:hypothetical protein [Bacillota bacterium]
MFSRCPQLGSDAKHVTPIFGIKAANYILYYIYVAILSKCRSIGIMTAERTV